VAIEDRIFRRIAFGFFVITVPPAGCAASKICHPLVERCEGYSHSIATLIGGMVAVRPVRHGRSGCDLISSARRLSMP